LQDVHRNAKKDNMKKPLFRERKKDQGNIKLEEETNKRN
jgi:hypothetical protein